MFNMEYKDEPHEILTSGRTWLTQAIYDYVYYDPLRSVRYYFLDPRYEEEIREQREGLDENIEEKPKYTLEYKDSDSKYSNFSRCRISSASSRRDDEAQYFVSFKESLQKLFLFSKSSNGPGEFIKSFNLSSNIDNDIKDIERITKKKKVYIDTYWDAYYRLPLKYDALRIRTHSNSYYIVYNDADYTSSDLKSLALNIDEESR